MSEDIVARLRELACISGHGELGDAADEIVRLRGEVERLTRERDDAKTDAEEWQDKYNDEHKTADELSIKLEGARTDWSLQSKISNGYAGALIIAEKARDAALARAEAAEAKVAKLREALTPFAAEAEFCDEQTRMLGAPSLNDDDGIDVSVGDLRRARAVLQETETKGE